eukprot:5640577-Pleurochrysis_carterae.AAC.1
MAALGVAGLLPTQPQRLRPTWCACASSARGGRGAARLRLRDGLERPSGARGGGLDAGHRVGDEGGEVVLQQPRQLQLDVVRRAVALVLAQRA